MLGARSASVARWDGNELGVQYRGGVDVTEPYGEPPEIVGSSQTNSGRARRQVDHPISLHFASRAAPNPARFHALVVWCGSMEMARSWRDARPPEVLDNAFRGEQRRKNILALASFGSAPT